MKKRIATVLILALIFTTTLALCGTQSVYAATSKGIHLSKTTLTLTAGTTKKISVRTSKNVKIDNSRVTWKSSDKSIAKVNGYGTITAVSKGTVKIKATYKNKTYTCKVTVKAKTAKQTSDGKSDSSNSDKATSTDGSDGSQDGTASPTDGSDGSNGGTASPTDGPDNSQDGTVSDKASGTDDTGSNAGSGSDSDITVTSLLPYAHYFGLRQDISWIDNPSVVSEYDNNILYSFLKGNYSLDFAFDDFSTAYTFTSILSSRIKYLSTTYPELMGSYCNGNVTGKIDDVDFDEYKIITVPYDGKLHSLVFIGYDRFDIQSYLKGLVGGTEALPQETMAGNNIVSIYIKEATLSNDELYEQQCRALEEAIRIKNKLHESGQITDSMSQKAIAQFYYEYLNTLGIEGSGINTYDSAGEYMKHDSLYGALILKQSDCVGRAALYNLFMHMEGIESQSVSCVFRTYTNVGHVLNRIVADGTELFVDWGNEISMRSQREMERYVVFDSQSLTMARTVEW